MIAEEAWRCDICRKRFGGEDTPAVDKNLEDLPIDIFQISFPGHRPKKGRNTMICISCAEKGGFESTGGMS